MTWTEKEDSALGQWAKKHNTDLTTLEVLVRADGRYDWKRDIEPLTKKSSSIKPEIMTALSGIISGCRNGAYKIPLSCITAVVPEMDETSLVNHIVKNYAADYKTILLSMPDSNRKSLSVMGINSKALPALLTDIKNGNIKITSSLTEEAKNAENDIFIGLATTPQTTTPAGEPERQNTETSDKNDAPDKDQTDDNNGTDQNCQEKMPESNDDSESQQSAQEPESKAKPEPPAKRAAVKKSAARKKTKYSTTKQTLSELFSDSGCTNDIRQMRMFLQAKSEFPLQELAFMTDAEVTDAFTGKYRSVRFPQGSLVIPVESFADIMETLAAADTYFIPDEKTEKD